MTDTVTSNLGLQLPQVYPADQWGGKLNANFTAIDVFAGGVDQANSRQFGTAADVLADTYLTYNLGTALTVSAGQYVRTESEGFSYKVAAAAATDQHVTTAGGVKLYVQADADGWRPLQAFGTVGDGVANDTARVQTAINVSPYLKGQPGATYRIASTVTIPDNRTIDLNGAKLRRGGLAQWMVETSKARTTWDNQNITLINWNCDDDGTTATRGNFNLLVGDRIKVFGYKVVAAAPYTGAEGAWSCYVSGEDIELHDLDVNTELAGLWSDAVHVGHVKRLIIGSHNLRCGDDAIALYAAPRNYSWCGRNIASDGVTIMPGFVSSTQANGIRIGGQEYISASEGASPANVVWRNVNIVSETVGQCIYPIAFEDRRVASDITAKSTEISVSLRVSDQTGALRLLYMLGNPDITDAANRAQHNFGRLSVNIEGKQTTSTGGVPGQIVYGGGVDRLEYAGDLFADTPAPTGTSHCLLYQIDDLVLQGIEGRSDTTAAFFSLNYIRRVYCIECDFSEDANLEFQTFNIPLNSDQDISVYMSGGRITDTARTFNISGTGSMKDFQLIGTRLVGSSSSLPNLGSVTSWTSGATVTVDPAGGLSSTVSQLFGSAVPVIEGHCAFATNGRKPGEGSGAGTGAPVYRNGTAWRLIRDDSVVAA